MQRPKYGGCWHLAPTALRPDDQVCLQDLCDALPALQTRLSAGTQLKRLTIRLEHWASTVLLGRGSHAASPAH